MCALLFSSELLCTNWKPKLLQASQGYEDEMKQHTSKCLETLISKLPHLLTCVTCLISSLN